MRIEQRRGLPPQELQRAASAARLRLVFELLFFLVLRFRDTAPVQHAAGHRRGETERKHFPHEGAARHAAGLHLCDQTVQCSLVHDQSSSGPGPRHPARQANVCQAEQQ
jgi:hypothetical protein